MGTTRIYFGFIISLLCFATGQAFHPGSSYTPAMKVLQPIKSDTIGRDIPVDKKGRSILFDRLRVARDSIGGLDVLENGFDSLQIRIWYSYAFKDSSQILIIRSSQQQWSAQLITNAWSEHSKEGRTVLKKDIRQLRPQNGWQQLIYKLWGLKFPTLPDYSSIAGYPETMDGDQVIVEIATRKNYRMFSYKDPILAKASIKEAKMMVEILKLLEKELQFHQLRGI